MFAGYATSLNLFLQQNILNYILPVESTESVECMYPLLFRGSGEVRLVCAQIVWAMERFRGQVPAKIFSVTDHSIGVLLRQVVKSHSEDLAVERARLSFINDTVSVAECVCERFSDVVRTYNNICEDFQLSALDTLTHTQVTPSIAGLRELSGLGSELYSWEKEFVERAIGFCVNPGGLYSSELVSTIYTFPFAQALDVLQGR